MIHHVAFLDDWLAAKATGNYTVSTLGRSLDEEGFIHASHSHQVDGVLGRFYRDVTEPLVLLTIDPSALGADVREETPPGADEAFPHIYGPIPVDAVVEVHPIDRSGDRTLTVRR